MLREISQMQTDRHGVKSPACGIRDRLTEAESGLQAARGWEGCGSSGHGVRSHGHTGARHPSHSSVTTARNTAPRACWEGRPSVSSPQKKRETQGEKEGHSNSATGWRRCLA